MSVPMEDQVPPTIRRPGRVRMLPPQEPTEDSGTVISRDLLGSRNRSSRSTLGTNRIIAGNLPDWDPTPPGEILIRRTR